VNTRRTFGLLTAILALSVLPGCWTASLHALYESGDPHLTYDPALVGTWLADPDSPLVISGDPKGSYYTLELTDEDGRQVYNGHLVQLGSYRFLDVVPSESYDATGKRQPIEPGYFPAHSILRVTFENGSLFLVAPDDARLCALARENKLTVGDCVDGDFMFTAGTSVVQEFLSKHADDLEIFDQRDPDLALHRAAKQGTSK
jgi:hypothetical protein